MMRGILALALVALCVAAAPARADDWDRFGDVEFGPSYERAVEFTRFQGRVTELKFKARRNTVECRSITAHFGNGRSRVIYQGRIRREDNVKVDLPGAERQIRRLSFVCRARNGNSARLIISGKNDATVSSGGRAWSRIGRATFGPRNEVEREITRLNGPFERIALRAVDDDARCRRIAITFGNGRTRVLNLGRDGYLEEDRLYTVDLPGQQRNVQAVTLQCRAAGGARDVTIVIFGINIRT